MIIICTEEEKKNMIDAINTTKICPFADDFLCPSLPEGYDIRAQCRYCAENSITWYIEKE